MKAFQSITSTSMTNDSLRELYSWSRAQLDKPVMLDYLVHKVNGQMPSTILILLRQPTSLVANAELEISYDPDRELHYQAIFSLLPFQPNWPRPDRLRPGFEGQQGVMQWIKTGRNREPLYSF
jgi:hypothetical protein